MKSWSHIRSRSGSRDGFALVMVLAFLVLLTILLVSFIAFMRLNRSATASYSKSIQAQEIAQGGIQDILGDVRSEIIAGSLAGPTYTVGSGSFATIYIPTTNLTAVPARLGYATTSWGTVIPTSAANLLPPTVIRVSRADPNGDTDGTKGTIFYPAANPLTSATLYPNMAAVPGGAILNRASIANTASPSFNGRSVSATRWNKSYLLAFRTSSIPSVFSQTATAPNGPPDWVYVTRTGSRVCLKTDLTQPSPIASAANPPTTTYTFAPGNPPASPVVGRYAYIMYDEGAMIDVDAAGSSSSAIGETTVGTLPTYAAGGPPTYKDSNTGIISEVLGKSNVGHADLTQLGGGFSQANVDAFLNWRSSGAISAVSTGGNAFLGAVFNNSQNKFLTFTPGDSPLLSRQDLINYLLNLNALKGAINITVPLPGLGTFSRASSAPSWFPTANSANLPGYQAGTGTAVNYLSNAETAGSANRDIPNVRWPSPFTGVVHYNDAGVAIPYNVNSGDPLLQNRFSLSRIAWLSTADPVGGTGPTTLATAIQSCFGLTWGTVGGSANGGNPCWSYVGSPAGTGGTLTAFNGTIETLDQVAKEAREPNFFEVLKATILNGSLGQNPGQAVFMNGTYSTTAYNLHNGQANANIGPDGIYAYSYDRSTTPTIPAPCQISDMQIMAIGANIIDQYDSDSYPTAIYFNYRIPTLLKQLSSVTTPVNADAANSAAEGNVFQYGTYGQSDMVFGQENLPLLLGMYKLACTVDGKPIGGSLANDIGPTAGLAMWWQPEVWNPYAEPNPLNGGTAPPQNFTIQGYGQINFEWGGGASPNTTGTSQATTLDGAETISFTDSAPTTSVFYAAPQLLVQTAGGLANVSTSVSDTTHMLATSSMEGWSGTVTGQNGTASVAPNHFVGFWAGTDPTYIGSTTFVNVDSSATGTPASFCLGWTAGGKFHPYSFLPGSLSYIYGVVDNTSGFEGGSTPAGFTDPSQISANWHAFIDPRTARFSSMSTWLSGWVEPNEASTLFAQASSHNPGSGNGTMWTVPNPASNPAFVYDQTTTTTKSYPWQDGYNEEDWEVNSPTPIAQAANTHPPTDKTYYADPDGVVRPADGVYGNWGTGDGMFLYTVNASPSGNTAMPNGTTNPAGDAAGNVQHGRRPIILNRPFRSLGELGYTFRDQPFKTLDFFSAYSADAALLDVFSLTDESSIQAGQMNSVVAGQIDLSNAPSLVIQALLSVTGKKDFDPNYYMSTGGPQDASKVAVAIANQLQPSSAAIGGGPLLNRANLVTSVTPAIRTANALINPSDQANKAYMEAPVRALADVANTRTWNLLIDIIAQSGQMAPTAQSLNDFVVQGEKRYWLHIAIDRYTGKIIDQQLEQVYE